MITRAESAKSWFTLFLDEMSKNGWLAKIDFLFIGRGFWLRAKRELARARRALN
jgi:hypothetical protein